MSSYTRTTLFPVAVHSIVLCTTSRMNEHVSVSRFNGINRMLLTQQ